MQQFQKKNIPWGLAAVAVAALLLVGGAVWFMEKNDAPASERIEVVATINGEEITQQMLDARIKQIASIQMVDPDQLDRFEILDLMISEALLLEDARNLGIAVDDKEAQALLEHIKAQFATQGEFEDALAMQNTTLEELIKDIERELIFEQYQAYIVVESAIEVTDEEVQAFYREFAKQEGAPPLDDIYTEVENHLLQEKTRMEFDLIIQQLLEQATVDILI